LAFEPRITGKLDDRHVRPGRVARGLSVRGIDVQIIGSSQREGVREVTVEDRRVIEQPTQDVELDAIGLGRIEADRPLRWQAPRRDGELAGTGGGLGLDVQSLAGHLA
jgi:hypothetical protein